MVLSANHFFTPVGSTGADRSSVVFGPPSPGPIFANRYSENRSLFSITGEIGPRGPDLVIWSFSSPGLSLAFLSVRILKSLFGFVSVYEFNFAFWFILYVSFNLEYLFRMSRFGIKCFRQYCFISKYCPCYFWWYSSLNPALDYKRLTYKLYRERYVLFIFWSFVTTVYI